MQSIITRIESLPEKTVVVSRSDNTTTSVVYDPTLSFAENHRAAAEALLPHIFPDHAQNCSYPEITACPPNLHIGGTIFLI